MEAKKVVIINVDELWLKGKNRPTYFHAIDSHIRQVVRLNHREKFRTKLVNQRIRLESKSPIKDETIQALLRVPGIHSVWPSIEVAKTENMQDILPFVLDEIRSIPDLPRTFKVVAKRSDKSFPITSAEVSKIMGGLILREIPDLKVDVRKPELVVDIKVLNKKIYISVNKLIGMGGQPWGTSGHVVTMISGGFDSPVASYLMSKRGCKQTFAFFYAYPFVGEEVKEKIVDICSHLAKFQKESKLYVIPFGNLQKAIGKDCQEEYRTIFFRKYMVECATLVAEREDAQALITGDSLGQVSSQTIGNLAQIDKESTLPIFRPLIGLNKVEIIEIARKIGTFDISVQPHDDACALFAPKFPVIRPNSKYWSSFTSEHNFEELLKESFDRAEVFTFSADGKMKKEASKNEENS